jgi:hypothetical protein
VLGLRAQIVKIIEMRIKKPIKSKERKERSKQFKRDEHKPNNTRANTRTAHRQHTNKTQTTQRQTRYSLSLLEAALHEEVGTARQSIAGLRHIALAGHGVRQSVVRSRLPLVGVVVVVIDSGARIVVASAPPVEACCFQEGTLFVPIANFNNRNALPLVVVICVRHSFVSLSLFQPNPQKKNQRETTQNKFVESIDSPRPGN